MASLSDAFKILVQIEGEREAITAQKPGDSEDVPAVHTRLFGRHKRIDIKITDEEKT